MQSVYIDAQKVSVKIGGTYLLTFLQQIIYRHDEIYVANANYVHLLTFI